MKQHIRYGTKNEDGTVTWGDWQTIELSQTVGNDTTLIYVDNGEIKASTATVGSAAQPVYLNSGTVTACNSTVGSSAQPVYLNGGTVTETNFKYYTSLEQLGLDSSATIEDVWGAMLNNSEACITVNEFSDTSQFPTTRAILKITIGNEYSRAAIHLYGKTSNEGGYRMFLSEGNSPDGVWWKIPYEQV